MALLTSQKALEMAAEHHVAGRSGVAEYVCRQVLNHEPNNPHAAHLMGQLALEQGRADIAIIWMKRAIEAGLNSFDLFCNLGTALSEAGNYSEAIAAYQRAIQIRPDVAASHTYLGNALRDLGELDAAIASYKKAISLDPASEESYCNLSTAHWKKDQFTEAVDAARQALISKPDYPEAFVNLGNALLGLELTDDAIAAYRNAIALKPDYFTAHDNLGNALAIKGEFDQAEAEYRLAIQLQPQTTDVHLHLASTLLNAGRLKQAIDVFDHALQMDPTNADAHFDLAFTLLLNGDFARGWTEYEWRWQTKNPSSPPRHFPQPLWDGADLAGRTLLIHTEQGFGDAIQFARYLPLIAAGRGKIMVESPPRLLRLLRDSNPGMYIVRRGELLPPFDVQCPLLSLPLIFRTTLENIPNQVPYLHADPTLVAQWQTRLGSGSQGKRVGLVWAGNPQFKNDKHRSPRELSLLAPLVDLPGIQFFSLQKGEAAAQTRTPPAGMNLTDLSQDLNDFSDTAAAIEHLDLVITSDTAVAHLAGALGKPVWVMLSTSVDWRWMLNRSDSPWYPTMRLFRQTRRGEWGDVVLTVRTALAEWAGQKS